MNSNTIFQPSSASLPFFLRLPFLLPLSFFPLPVLLLPCPSLPFRSLPFDPRQQHLRVASWEMTCVIVATIWFEKNKITMELAYVFVEPLPLLVSLPRRAAARRGRFQFFILVGAGLCRRQGTTQRQQRAIAL